MPYSRAGSPRSWPSKTPASASTPPGTGDRPRPSPGQADGSGPVTSVPPSGAAARVCGVLLDHPRWSAFWDKRHGVWRVAEDDPDSDLYAKSSDADIVIGYIQAHA